MPKAGEWQEKKQDLARGVIWNAAMELFAERGYEQVTIEEIARAAGVSRRTYFRYFSSKADLIGQAIVSYGQLLERAIGASPKALRPMEVLRRVVGEVAREAVAQEGARRLMAVLAQSEAAREAHLGRMAEAEERVVAAYAARGRSKDPTGARLSSKVTFAVLDVAFRQWFERGGGDAGAMAERVLRELGKVVGAE